MQRIMSCFIRDFMALEPVKLETKILQLETTVHIFEEIIQNKATPMELN